jgi:MFS family permease
MEGGFVGVIADKLFHVHPAVLALITAAPMFGNLSSSLWARLAHGRRRVPLATALLGGFSLCVAAVALIPEGVAGTAVLVGLQIASRQLLGGFIALRSIVWSLNYPREARGRVIARLAVISTLGMAGTSWLGGQILNGNPQSFRLVYALGAVVSALGVWAFSRVPLAGEDDHLAQERRSRTEGSGPRGVIGLLLADRLYASFMGWQMLSGISNMMVEAPVLYLVSRQMKASYAESIAATTVVPLLLSCADGAVLGALPRPGTRRRSGRLTPDLLGVAAPALGGRADAVLSNAVGRAHGARLGARRRRWPWRGTSRTATSRRPTGWASARARTSPSPECAGLIAPFLGMALYLGLPKSCRSESPCPPGRGSASCSCRWPRALGSVGRRVQKPARRDRSASGRVRRVPMGSAWGVHEPARAARASAPQRRRTRAAPHPPEQLVRPGMRVLDAGCGVGLTRSGRRARARTWSPWTSARPTSRGGSRGQPARGAASAGARGSGAAAARRPRGPLRPAPAAALRAPRRDEAALRLARSHRPLPGAGRSRSPQPVTLACDPARVGAQDHPTRQRELRAELGTLRGRLGLAFEPLLEELGRHPDPRWLPARRADGTLERSDARQLGRPSDVHRLDVTRSFDPLPKSTTLSIGSPGTLGSVLFTQTLAFGDDVVAEHESLGWLAEPLRVEPGERWRSLDERWREANTLALPARRIRAEPPR